jgi:hypothetical protein
VWKNKWQKSINCLLTALNHSLLINAYEGAGLGKREHRPKPTAIIEYTPMEGWRKLGILKDAYPFQ